MIGEFKELEKQEIYFSSPDELNDPIEGFKNMFWSGDQIVWKNFIKHYLLCLEGLCEAFFIGGEDFHIPVFRTPNDFPTQERKNLYQEVCEQFFKNVLAVKWPQTFASRKGMIKQNELSFYFKSMHAHAINTILAVYDNHGLIPQNLVDHLPPQFSVNDVIDAGVVWANDKEAQRPDLEDATERFYAVIRHQLSQNEMIAFYNAPLRDTVSQKNRRFLFTTFPEEYMKCLERLVHNEWYAACFTGNFNNSSMWGHYGDQHKGVCLIFKTHKINDEPHLKLYRINGTGGSKGDMRPHYGYSDTRFYKIGYEKKYPETDFFRSLGTIPTPALNQCWFFDEKGKKSSYADAVYGDEETWRKNYWNTFLKAITTKLEDWSYENEYRLVLTPMTIDFSDKQNRKLKYQFNDLEGIIFGIKTPEDTIIDIIRIIKEKCHLESRTDFKFYQAFYSKETGRIDTAKMNFIFNS